MSGFAQPFYLFTLLVVLIYGLLEIWQGRSKSCQGLFTWGHCHCRAKLLCLIFLVESVYGVLVVGLVDKCLNLAQKYWHGPALSDFSQDLEVAVFLQSTVF